jgi:hypothetical protein
LLLVVDLDLEVVELVLTLGEVQLLMVLLEILTLAEVVELEMLVYLEQVVPVSSSLLTPRHK